MIMVMVMTIMTMMIIMLVMMVMMGDYLTLYLPESHCL